MAIKLLIISLTLLIATGCGSQHQTSQAPARTTVLGSDGRLYVRVSIDIPQPDGTVIRETWQPEGEVGTNRTTWFKIHQTPSDTNAPTFVVAERKEP